MAPSLLILGGTLEATALAHRLAELRIPAIVSLAGRVAHPKRQPLPTRNGGFGGAEALARYISSHGISHVIDATHPFAAQISRNAVEACTRAAIPLVCFSRPAWQKRPSDRWHSVANIKGAVEALSGPPARVFLAIGRMHLPAFAPVPQHHYVLRLVDPPATPLPLPHAKVIVDRGPFTVEDDRALMLKHGIELIVSKNSGGKGASAKLSAARSLRLPVIMIERPALPHRPEVDSVDAVLDWLSAHGADLGV